MPIADPASPETKTPVRTDIAIIGGGLSGTLAALLLGRAGIHTVLIDLHAERPAEFRVEKIGGEQVGTMRRLGILDAVAKASAPFDEIVNVRRGTIIDRSTARHYGMLYPDLTAAVRREVPANVRSVVGRVLDLQTGPERQHLRLADGTEIEARLVVVATGMSDSLRAKLGIERRALVEKHSVTFGFDVVPGENAENLPPALTFYGGQTDKIDYLSIFPTPQGLRANLFGFMPFNDPWIKRFRTDPKATLLEAVPELQRFLGEFSIPGRVQNWIMDLSVVDKHRQAGVVLIGDAFQTSCPAAGTGVSRLLTDAERLCLVHIPRWLATPDMRADKIDQFYDDREKLASDARALELAEFRRQFTVDPTLPWELRRRRQFSRRWLVERARAGARLVGIGRRISS